MAVLSHDATLVTSEDSYTTPVDATLGQCPAEWWALRLILGVNSPLSIAAVPPPVPLVALRWAWALGILHASIRRPAVLGRVGGSSWPS